MKVTEILQRTQEEGAEKIRDYMEGVGYSNQPGAALAGLENDLRKVITNFLGELVEQELGKPENSSKTISFDLKFKVADVFSRVIEGMCADTDIFSLDRKGVEEALNQQNSHTTIKMNYTGFFTEDAGFIGRKTVDQGDILKNQYIPLFLEGLRINDLGMPEQEKHYLKEFKSMVAGALDDLVTNTSLAMEDFHISYLIEMTQAIEIYGREISKQQFAGLRLTDMDQQQKKPSLKMH